MNHTESPCWFQKLETEESESKTERKSVSSVDQPLDPAEDQTAGKCNSQKNSSNTGGNLTDTVNATVDETNFNKSIEACNIGSPIEKGKLRTNSESSHVIWRKTKHFNIGDCRKLILVMIRFYVLGIWKNTL